jgi:hypothetical protein
LGESYRNLFSDAQDEDDYQIEKQKIAIASGEYI